MTPTPKLERNENHRKRRVIHNVENLNAASPEWKVDEVRKLATVSTVPPWKHHTRSRCGTPTVHCGPVLGQGKRCTNESSFVRTRKQNLLFSAKVLVSVASATRSCRSNEMQKCTTRLGKNPLRDFSCDSRRTVQSKPHSGQANLETGYKRVCDVAAPARLEALIAAKPRIQAMIQDAVTAGSLPKQSFETRLVAVIETARHNGPDVMNPQNDESRDVDFSSTLRKSRLNAPQLQAQLSQF